MNKVSGQIEDTLRGMSKSEQKLSEASNTISLKMEEIVSRIDERIKEHMQETEHNLSEQISAMNGGTFTEEPNVEDTADIKIKEFVDNLKKGFLNSTSGTGVLILYVCCLSLKYNKEFSISDLLRNNEQYTYGFLISTLSIGLINATIDEKMIVRCSKIGFAQKDIVEKLQEMVGKFGQDFLNQINTVNRYFGVEEMKIGLK